MLLRGRAQVRSAVLLGTTPTPDGLYISDHYGVQTDLTLTEPETHQPGTHRPTPHQDRTRPATHTSATHTSAAHTSAAGAEPHTSEPPTFGPPATTQLTAAQPTARTALAWIPPHDLWPSIQELRAEHDPQIDRWPPHVNLLFGFLPEPDFERAAPLLAQAAAEITPFTVRLEGVRLFEHRDSATLWLDPATGTAATSWAALHRAFERRFPNCRGRAEGFTPHLTLGRAPTRDARALDPQALAARCANRLAPMTARVDELVLLSRRADEPMRPRALIALGTGEIRWLPDPPTGDPAEPPAAALAHDPLAGHVVRRLTEALDPAVIHLTGSRAMDCARTGADIDLVAVLPGDPAPATLRTRVQDALPEADRIRPVIGAKVPGLRLHLRTPALELPAGSAGVEVDLAIVATGNMPPAEAVPRRAELGRNAAIALSAISDAEAIRTAAGPRHAYFAHLARQVKAWARARGLDSAPFGGLPGLAWAILAARTVTDVTIADLRPDEHPAGDDELLRTFFATWAAWDWRHPVHLTQETATETYTAPAAMTVMTPCPPVRNCAQQVGEGGRDLLIHELYQAWETLESGAPWTDLLSPPPLHRRHASWAVLTITAHRPDELDPLVGRVRGRLRDLLTRLEDAGATDAHAWPRPYPANRTQPGTVRYAIGLGHTPPTTATITDIARTWSRGLDGVTLETTTWADIPTLH
ncbi:hypothetical protein HII36_51830 [Nonomuraea sp. NN258]|nr:hypothetical protein [Nonomuraea antri]